MPSFKRLSAVAKFLVIIGLFGGLSVVSAMFSALQMHAIDDGYTGAVKHQDKASVWMSRAASALKGTKGFVAELMLAPTGAASKAALDGIQRQRHSSLKYLDEAKAADPSQGRVIDHLKQQVVELIDQTCAKAIGMGRESISRETTLAAQTEYTVTCGPAYTPVIDSIVSRVDAAMTEQNETADSLAQLTKRTILLNYS